MKLHIKKDGMLSDIQKEFNDYFPYLWIEFFSLPHKKKELSPKNDKLNKFSRIGGLVKLDNDKVVELNEKMTIIEFESLIAQQVNLNVQVLRKSGRIWLETSLTDDWTLEHQNEEGRMMSSIHDVSSEGQVEWDDWE
jgi:hypothetical protein